MSAPRRASDAPECIDAVECILSFQCSRSFIQSSLRSQGGYIRMLTDWLEQAKAANRLPSGAVLGPKVSYFNSSTTPPKLVKKYKRSFVISAAEPLVSVKTGGDEEPTTFQVHQSVLCSSSGFLEARSKPEWSTGTAVVNLSHVNSEAFTLYVNWLYTSDIQLRRIVDGDPDSPIRMSAWKLLATAYILGDELIDANFQNSVADVMAMEGSNENHTLNAEATQLIWDGTAQLTTSKARSLFADIFHSHNKKFLHTLPAQLVSSIAKEARYPTPVKHTVEADPCFYHEHMGNDEQCFANGGGGWEVFYQKN